jgi:hypothetical protein
MAVSFCPSKKMRGAASVEKYRELLEMSLNEKRGLTFFIKGQTIAGIVTKIIDSETVEARSQMYGRIIIRLDQVDALAAN